MSYIKSGNGFNDIEDVDDNTFLNHPRQGHSGYVLNDSSHSALEDKRQQLLEERRRIEEKTLQSTKTSLGLIYETEKVGLQTAEELLHQREQLNNVNDKLDSINSIMRVSQKHLTSMKSIFGGVKNYFSKNTDTTPAATAKRGMSSSASESKLQSTVQTFRSESENTNSQMSHPALKRRGLESFDEEPKPANASPHVSSSSSAYDLHSREIDRQLDQNLEDMGLGISRLKDLALGLGNEIEGQNQLLDSLATKSERAQDTIANQNRQMKRILKS